MNEIKKTVKFSKSFLFLITFIILLVGVIAPVSYLIYTSSGDLIWTNMTEGTNLGARLAAAVLSMDFNTPAENILSLVYQNGSLYQFGTYIKDGSVYNNFGTSSGLNAQYWWNGNTNGSSKISGSLQFDGVNDYVVVPTSNNLNFESNDFTLSAWVKTSGTAVERIIIDKTITASPYTGYELEMQTTGKARFNFGNVTNNAGLNGVTLINDSNWHYVVATRANNNGSIYVDGVLENSSLNFGGNVTNTVELNLGRYRATNSLWWNGSIDDVIIWSRALNASEISTIYSEGLAGRAINADFLTLETRNISTEGLVGHWRGDSINNTNVVTGKVGNALNFNGMDNWISGGNNINLDNASDGTISIWFNAKKTADTQFLYGYAYYKDWYTARLSLEIDTNNKTRVFLMSQNYTSPGQNYLMATFNTITFDSWHNIFYTTNSSGNWFYYDGVIQTGNYTAGNSSANAFINRINVSSDGWQFIGGIYSSLSFKYFFNGSIDEVRVWNRSLSPIEIANLYGNESMGITDPNMDRAGLQSEYLMNENSTSNYGAITPETSGNSLDGDIYGDGIYVLDSSGNNYTGGVTALSLGLGKYSNSFIAGKKDNGITTNPSGTSCGGISCNGRVNISQVGILNSINATGNATFSMWIYPYSTTTSEIFSIQQSRYLNNLHLYYQTSLPRFGIYNITSNQAKVVNGPTARVNRWLHLVGTVNSSTDYSSTTICLYTDTNYAGCTTTPNFNFSAITFADIGNSKGSEPFNGSIDEVMIYNRVLSSSEIQGLYDSQRQKLHLLLDEFNGTSASSIGENASITGTLTGYPAINPTAPIYNATGGPDGSGAYVFDGVDDYLNVGTSNNFNIINDLTVSAWIKAGNQPSAAGRVVSRRNTASGYELYILQTSGNPAFIVAQTEVAKVSTMNLMDNQWHLVTYTYSNGNTSAYIDGEYKTSQTGYNIASNSGDTLWIGDITAHTRAFNGTIDNVQIFNRALSASEILELYNGTNANRTIKYSTNQGDFTSGVFYNSTQTYWNVSLSTADTISSRSGVVNTDNSINISNPNLVSYWALDGNFSEILNRSLNNWIISGTSGLNNFTGISSKAILFDGIDDNVWLSYANITGFNFNYTASFWFYERVAPGASTPQYMVSIGDGTASKYDAMGLGNGNKIFMFNGVTDIQTRTAVSLNQWNNYILTRNGTNVSIYLNGNLENSTIMTNTMIGSKLRVGFRADGGAYFYNGSIDEVLVYNKTLTPSEVSQLYKSGLSQHANTNVTLHTRTANSYNVSDPSLVGFWALNENDNITAIDETGINNGTYMGGAKSNLSSGIIGSGAFFDGSNDIINISNSVGLMNGQNEITLSAWINYRVWGTADGIVCTRSTNTGAPITGLNTGATGIFSFYISTGTTAATTSASYTTGKWYHLTGTWSNGDRARLYIDGQLVANSSIITLGGGLIVNKTWIIGLDDFNSARIFDGFIDEVRIYNRSLSADEVMNLYQLGSMHISDWGNWTNSQTCYDNETRIQTESGWKLFSELNKTDKVATLNPKTNEIEYKLPSEYQVYDAPEFMYKIITEKGEMIVSPDHKVYSATAGEKGYWKLVVGILMIVIGLAGLWKILRFGGKNE